MDEEFEIARSICPYYWLVVGSATSYPLRLSLMIGTLIRKLESNTNFKLYNGVFYQNCNK